MNHFSNYLAPAPLAALDSDEQARFSSEWMSIFGGDESSRSADSAAFIPFEGDNTFCPLLDDSISFGGQTAYQYPEKTSIQHPNDPRTLMPGFEDAPFFINFPYCETSGRHSHGTQSLGSYGCFDQQSLCLNELQGNSLSAPLMDSLTLYNPWNQNEANVQHGHWPFSPADPFHDYHSSYTVSLNETIERKAVDLLLQSLPTLIGQVPDERHTPVTAAPRSTSTLSTTDEQPQTRNHMAFESNASREIKTQSASPNRQPSFRGVKRKREPGNIISPSSVPKSTCKDEKKSPEPTVFSYQAERKPEESLNVNGENSSSGQERPTQTQKTQNIPHRNPKSSRKDVYLRLVKVGFPIKSEIAGESSERTSTKFASWQWDRRNDVYKSGEGSVFDMKTTSLLEFYGDQGPGKCTVWVETGIKESIMLRWQDDIFRGISSTTGQEYEINKEQVASLLYNPRQSVVGRLQD